MPDRVGSGHHSFADFRYVVTGRVLVEGAECKLGCGSGYGRCERG